MKLWELFWTFIKIGTQAFGGGYTIIMIAQETLVKKKKWLTKKEVTDYLALSSSLSGIIALNFSAFTGYHIAGIKGAITAVFGITLPPFFVILGLAGIMEHLTNHSWLTHALYGIQIFVCALILSFVISLYKETSKKMPAKILIACTFCIFCLFNISPIVPLIGSGIIGYLYYRFNKKVFGK